MAAKSNGPVGEHSGRVLDGPTNPMVTPLLTDLYQFTMAYAYWKAGKHNERAVSVFSLSLLAHLRCPVWFPRKFSTFSATKQSFAFFRMIIVIQVCDISICFRFDLYFRKNPFGGEYTIFAGLEECIRFIANFKLSEDEIDFVRESLSPSCEVNQFLNFHCNLHYNFSACSSLKL